MGPPPISQEKSVIMGCVEHISRRRIYGWTKLKDSDHPDDLIVTLRFGNQVIEFEGPLLERADFGGLRCGYTFNLPPHCGELSPPAFLDNFVGVFAKSKSGFNDGEVQLPLLKSVMSSFLEGEMVRMKGASRKIAVLIRSHLVSVKALQLARELERVEQIDIFFCVDETQGSVQIGQYRHLSHSAVSLGEIGLWSATLPGALFYYGDMPFYAVMLEIPKYEHYLMVEYDVSLANGGIDWFRALVARLLSPSEKTIDLFAPQMLKPNQNWYWYDHGQKVLGSGELWAANFPIICLSKAAVTYLFSERLKESDRARRAGYGALISKSANNLAYCEYFVPTVLRRSSQFTICSAAEIGLTWDDSIFSDFTVNVPLLYGADNQGNSALRHPVLDWDQYIGKVKNFMKAGSRTSDRDWSKLLKYVEFLPEDCGCHPVIRSFIESERSMGLRTRELQTDSL